MRKRVLLVEDEPDVARLLAYHLDAAGFDVTWVERGLEGLARARAESPVVIILDVMLPDLSGFDGASGCAKMPRPRAPAS